MTEEETQPEEVTEVETEVVETEEVQAEESEAQEVAEGDSPSEEEAEKPDAKHNYDHAKKRIEQKERKRQQELETVRLENERLKEQMRINNTPAQPVQQEYRDPNAPSIETFEGDTDAYVRAVIGYESEKKAKQQVTQKIVSTFDEREVAYKSTSEHYEEDLQISTSPKPAPFVAQAILKSELGPQLLHELVKDEALAYRLNRMDNIDAMREIMEIEKRLSVKPAVSSASAPITSPKTAIPKGTTTISEGLSQADYNSKMTTYRKTGVWPQ